MDIPLIIGLDILRSRKLLVNYVDNSLQYCNEGIKRPFKCKLGYVFFEWNPNEILFTRGELVRLHLHFMRPSSQRLFELISRFDPTKNDPSMRKLIDSITKAWSTCRSFKFAPLPFKASIPKEHIIFNHTISIDLLWLNEKPVIHVIDEETKCLNAWFLKSRSSVYIWNAFIGCWVST